jgi:two-component system response regulator AtoC
MTKLLLVDDEPAMQVALKQLARTLGHEPVVAGSGAEALERLEGVDAVITDYAMPGMSGLELVEAIHGRDASIPVVVLTAQGSERVAVRAMKAGAWDYVTKPFDVDELAAVIDRALEARDLRRSNRRLTAERSIGRTVIGASPAMRGVLAAVERLAPKDITVLVRGETGTGKELVSALIHAQSPRAGGPLVRFNCAAIPPDLAEAELFGHTRGAFTGAAQARRGFFAQAHGGTLVLDEVGELPLGVQAKLLRALQEGEIQPVGAGRVERVDVRVVACTNRDLAADTRSGRFREDLYYRLAVVEVVVPPLRDRPEDVAPLAAEFARRYAERFGARDVRLAPDLVLALRRAPWPGNVRELENAVARMVALSGGGEIPASAFAPPAAPSRQAAGDAGEAQADAEVEAGSPGALTLREHLDAVERSLIASTLAEVGGNQSRAARRLGLSRSALIDRLKKYGL